jgi:hypothetical protein
VALGLIRLLVGVGVRAAVSQRRHPSLGAMPPPPAPMYVPGAMLPPRASVSHVLPALALFAGSCAVLTGVVLIAGQAMVSSVDTDPDRWMRLAAGVAGNTVVCMAPGVLMYAVAGWSIWRNRRFARLQALCDTHARLPIATLATHLGTSEEMASALVLDAVERKLIHARLDLEPGIILSGTAAIGAGRQWAGQCRSCSAQVSVVLAQGQPAICPYCRGALGATG